MAIKKSIKTESGIDIQDAYHRVGRVQIVNKTEMTFTVDVLANSAAVVPVESKSYSCNYNLSGSNAQSQAYMHLKALPEFVNSIDC